MLPNSTLHINYFWSPMVHCCSYITLTQLLRIPSNLHCYGYLFLNMCIEARLPLCFKDCLSYSPTVTGVDFFNL